MAQLAHELVEEAAARQPTATALRHGTSRLSYAALAAAVAGFGAALRACGCGPDERVAVRLPATFEAVTALLGAGAAGCAFVLVDPAMAPQQCAALLRDAGARVLVTTGGDLADAAYREGLVRDCSSLRTLVVVGGADCASMTAPAGTPRFLTWETFVGLSASPGPLAGSCSLAALVYGSGAAGEPRGVALSHRNLVAGAASSARCLGMAPGDRVSCSIGLHLDYGLNALLATFAAGATALLHETPDPATLTRLLERGQASGLIAAAPEILRTLCSAMPPGAAPCLRFLACAGGGLDRASLAQLRAALPRTRIHLLYDIGDACRATSLMPSQLEEHPGSIGRPLPYADLRIVRPDGRECAPGETGELVRRGDLVPLGYWNDARAGARRLRLLPAMPGLSNRETGHFPGASARRDADGYLYPVDARGDTILTGGYRVSPREVEKIVVGTGLVLEAAAIGIAHPVLGQVIAVLATPRPGARLDSAILFGACRARLPRHMLPSMVDVRRAPLPRADDGQIDRARLAGELAPVFAEVAP